jgi:hypothetical protein
VDLGAPASDIMLRRAFLGFLPAFLALAFLCGTPGTSGGGAEASVLSWSTGVANAPVVRGDLTRDIPDDALGQRADQDDNPDDRIVRLAITIIWPAAALQVSFLDTGDNIRPTHRPCAARPRAPPFA